MQTSDPLTLKIAIFASGPHQVIGLYLKLNDIKKNNVKERSKSLIHVLIWKVLNLEPLKYSFMTCI